MLYLHDTKYLSCTTPMASQAIVSYFRCSKAFSTFTQYMSVSHGYSTMGGIEGGSRQKGRRKFSNQLGKLIGYGDAHQLILVQVSRDCHATDALEL